jgi:hypothetical protein
MMSKFKFTFSLLIRKIFYIRTIPLASFYDARQGTIKMDYNQGKKVMMTIGTDRTIKVWDMSSVI